jgi:hypothetical protein
MNERQDASPKAFADPRGYGSEQDPDVYSPSAEPKWPQRPDWLQCSCRDPNATETQNPQSGNFRKLNTFGKQDQRGNFRKLNAFRKHN